MSRRHPDSWWVGGCPRRLDYWWSEWEGRNEGARGNGVRLEGLRKERKARDRVLTEDLLVFDCDTSVYINPLRPTY